MANSDSKTPLLGGEGDALPEAESKRCCFDRVGRFFALVFARQNLIVAAGPLGTLLTLGISKYLGIGDDVPDGTDGPNQIGVMLSVLVWMAIWWMLEPVPIAVTSLLPLALFPFFEIMTADEVASYYTNDIVVLMLGTFILALAISRYNLHKRMALKILLLAGGEKMNARLVLFGFIAAPAFVSMWMFNTATAAMMIPMACGLLNNLGTSNLVPSGETSRTVTEEGGGRDGMNDKERAHAEEAVSKFSRGVILGVTYGITLGGMASPIGCGPNLVLPGMYSERFPNAPKLTFLQWMKFGPPVVLVWLLPLWLYLCWLYCPATSVPIIQVSLNRTTMEKAYRALGSISFAETFILSEFLVLIVLWVTRTFGNSPGWSATFKEFPNDGTVAVAAAIVLFMVPNYQKEREMIMDWKNCKNISWSVILLLGGGFALAKGIKVSGVSTWFGDKMEFLDVVPYYLLTPVISVLLHGITEFSSNSAIATLFLPIIADVALSIDVHPLLLLIPATFAVNSAFLLPSGTPPNAMALETGYVNIHQMRNPGFFMHIVGILILSVATPTLGAYVFGLNQTPSSMPWYFS